MVMTFREGLQEQLKDPEFRAEYEALEPEYQLISAMIRAREEQKVSQRQLAERTGIAQADISRIETGDGNPTLQTLQRLAAGLGMKLRLDFVPTVSANSSMHPM